MNDEGNTSTVVETVIGVKVEEVVRKKVMDFGNVWPGKRKL